MKKRYYLILLLAVLTLFGCHKTPEEQGGQEGGGIPKNATVLGTVTGPDGVGLADVVVSDGYQCVKTLKDGTYGIVSDLEKVKFISVSIPSGYKVAAKDGVPQFFVRLSEQGLTNGKYQNINFHLEKFTGNASRCTVVFAADPQSRKSDATLDNVAFHSLDCQKDLFDDMGDFGKTVSGREIFGIVLGDLVHENMTLYSNYAKDLKRAGFPVFNIIGNHDHNTKAADDDAGAADYEKYFGPATYSFNIAGFHFVMLDDMIMKLNSKGELKDYNTGLTDEVMEWLRQDLGYVSKSTPIMVCAHSPMFRLKSGSERFTSSNTINGKRYAELFGKFDKVYAWAGHTHSAFNYAGSTGTYPNIETHTLTRSTGELWTNVNSQEDGFPRSYVVVELDGSDISWKLKTVDRETGTNRSGNPELVWNPFTRDDAGKLWAGTVQPGFNYQIHAYPRGTYGDNYVYANVLMYDEKWGKVVFVDSGGAESPMTRVTTAAQKYDLSYKECFEWYASKGHYASYLNSSRGETFPEATAASLFRFFSQSAKGSGYVKAIDRFGNEFKSATISW